MYDKNSREDHIIPDQVDQVSNHVIIMLPILCISVRTKHKEGDGRFEPMPYRSQATTSQT